MTTASGVSSKPSPAGSIPFPVVGFPDDPGLPDLGKLFDLEDVWQEYLRRFQCYESRPETVRVRQLSHSVGRSAVVSYAADWSADEYLPTAHFSARIQAGKPVEFYRFPDDPLLPGLRELVDPDTALRLVNRHVFAVGARRILVEVVRYRPSDRAVLRHKTGNVAFYVRLLRPDKVTSILSARERMLQSRFVVPRLAGHWTEGGAVWLSEIPGKNLRREIRRGRLPDCRPILDGLESLWNVPEAPSEPAAGNQPTTSAAFDLAGVYRRAKRIIRHYLAPEDPAYVSLRNAVDTLDPFVQSWQPSAMAHNDFYDDQVLWLPDDRVAVVDFEEAGPGDPMLDVGNFLAHLHWDCRLGRKSEASRAYYNTFRLAALERFGWDEQELNLREAVCLFRICTNAVRRPRADWRDKLADGLSLVNETLA